MTQPNAYWTLSAPFVTIIGIYSNVPEGGKLDEPQIAWLQGELQDAPKDKALIVAMHHPIYSAYGAHTGSEYMRSVLEEACQQSNRTPHLVLAGHVHDYQRFIGPLNGTQIPFVVAGAGGYSRHMHVLPQQIHDATLPLQVDGQGITLESFCDDLHGYLKLDISKDTIHGDYFAVPNPEDGPLGTLKPFDSFDVSL